MNTLVRGNSFYLKVNVFVNDGESVQPLNLQTVDTVEANIYQELSGKRFCHSVERVEGTENQLLIDVKDIPNGRKYVVEVVGLYNSRPFRGAKVGYIGVVEYNADSTPIFNDSVDITVDFQSGYLCITKNAYEIAVQEGYQGTLADYIAELVDNGNSAKEAREATAEAISATANANEATERANQAASSAESATADAINATQQAVTATTAARTATQEAILRASEAHEATEAANSATDKAKDATTAANEATANANAATTAANGAASTANQAASAARTATNEATAATANAITATQQATIATTNAVNATNSANTATANANEATQRANTAASNTESYLEQAQTDEATRIANENQRIANETQRETFYEHFDEALETKANKDGFYETLGAGTALNLQGNTSKDATFTYRTAGGTEDIASGLATIHSIKGNTVVWNQIIKSKYRNAEMTLQEDVSLYYTDFPRFESGYRHTLYVNHKYYTKAKIAYTTQKEYSYATIQLRHMAQGANYNVANTNQSSSIFTCNADTQTVGIRFMVLSTAQEAPRFLAGDTLSYSDLMLIDLTLMFGAGNEPSTVEEFEEWLTNNVGLQDYYEYSEPTMLSADANSLETVGFNLWDGTYSRDNSWYNGTSDTIGGDSKYAISNFISVFPNTEYFIKGTSGANVGMAFFDKDKVNLKQSIIYNNRTSFTFTTPTNAAYLKFTVIKANKNITNLNLSWSGIRNGEYKEYWKYTYPINVKQLTSNGTVIFPNGMNRVGNVYDEIVSVDGVTKAIKRIGSVDLGTRNWVKRNSSNPIVSGDENVYFEITSSQFGQQVKNAICSKYLTVFEGSGGAFQSKADKTLIYGHGTHTIVVKDSTFDNYTTAQFKEAMNGVMLYYELATPIEYEIDNFEMPLAYKVDDFGTEETKKDTFSLSPTFAITYGVNAVDTLRRLPTNYISKESMQNFLSALGVQMGGTWTMTLDNNEYKFSFVANSNENEG